MKVFLQLMLFLIGSAIVNASFDYEHFKVYNIRPTTEQHLKILQDFEGHYDFDFWTDPIISESRTTDVMVAPAAQEEFEGILNTEGIEFSVLHDDMSNVIKTERIALERAKALRSSSSRIEFDQYYRFDQINSYLNNLELTYPGIVTLEAIGASLQGREMIAIKISSGPITVQKPIVLIDGGIHAREWISPITVIYIIDQLVTNSSNAYLYQNVDWYILPVLNPDGYEYTFTDQRLWRKSRALGFLCWGVDLNRNYDFEWGGVGASTSECSETYRGPSASSDIETRIWSTFILKYAANIKLYLSFHSYGRYFLYPWGYTSENPPNGDEQDQLGRNAANAIRAVAGTSYTVGPSGITLYPTSGSSVDFAYGAANIPYSYTVELPDNSFIVAPERILPIGIETFEAARVMGEYIASKYGRNE